MALLASFVRWASLLLVHCRAASCVTLDVATMADGGWYARDSAASGRPLVCQTRAWERGRGGVGAELGAAWDTETKTRERVDGRLDKEAKMPTPRDAAESGRGGGSGLGHAQRDTATGIGDADVGTRQASDEGTQG